MPSDVRVHLSTGTSALADIITDSSRTQQEFNIRQADLLRQ